MSYKISGKDWTTLPDALLDPAKQHMRVDFTDDDALITSILARAIDLYERKTGLAIFAADLAWTPDDFDTVCSDGVLVPAQPLAAITVTDIDDADVTTAYQIAGNQIEGQFSGIYFRPIDTTATMPLGLTVESTVGYDDATKLPPATLDSILRITAHLYANREAISNLLLRDADWWVDDLLVGAWVPRV